jgi:hypothetical protein
VTTAADLDRIKSLVAGLTALGKVQPGDAILAQRWNDLIGIVISLAQAVLTSSQSTTVPPHEHPDQVKLDWLDPSFRTLVEKGPLSDPVAVRRVTDIDHRVSLLLTDLQTVRDAVTSAGDRLAEMAAKELVRDANVTEISRVVTTIDQRKDAITELRQTLDSIQSKVDQAIATGAHLTINGAPVDMEAINKRITAVEDLRKNLTLSNGALLDARTFEGRMLDLQNSVVTQAQLDAALKLHATEVPKETIDALQSAVTTALRTEFNATFDKLKTDVAADTDRKLATVDGTVAQRLDERLPGAIDQALGPVKTLVTTTADQVRTDARGFADASATAAAATVTKDLGGRIDSIQSGFAANVKSVLDTELPTRLGAVSTTATTALNNAAAATTALNNLSADVQSVRTRAEQIALQSDTAVKNMQGTLIAEMDRRDGVAKQNLDARFTALSADVDQRIDTRLTPKLAEFQTAMNATMTQTAADAANAAVKSASVQLRADMTTIAHDQAASIQDSVRIAVAKDLDTTITDKVAAALKKGPGGIGTTVPTGPVK